MSENWVTPTGLVKKTLAEIKAEYEALFRVSFGDTIDLRAEGPFGQIVGLLSKRDADLWDLIQEIYTSRDPGQATGISLDGICAETGVRRLDATATVVDWVRLFGDADTTIPQGSKIRRAGSDQTYSLAGDVSIHGLYSEVHMEAPTGAGTYTATIDGTPYTYAEQPGDTSADIIAALAALIDADPDLGAQSIAGPLLRVYRDDGAFSITVSGLTIEVLASPGTFVCDTDGAIAVPEGTLTEIVTPVSGWDSVYNPIAGTTGREVETDAELRARRLSSARTGKATEQAILSALYDQVLNIVSVTIQSNRTSVTDGDGRPPKSFEVVVSGGLDADVAQVIWDTMPAGIESYGNTSYVVTDSQGFPQTVNFSRPETKYLWVNILRSKYTEESYPTDGDQQIKDQIVSWASTEYQLGKDVILQRLGVPIYRVPGIEDLSIEIALTDLPTDTPTFGTANLPVGVREIVQADADRITVGDL